MTLLVRNEADIVEANLRFHLDEFADQVIVTDNGSSDGTRDILGEFASTSELIVIDEPADDYDQARWVTRMALMARDMLGADWIINNDADEFWAVPGGDLRSVLERASAPIQRCERLNFVGSLDGPERLPWPERLIYRAASPTPRPPGMDLLRDRLPAPYFLLRLPGKVALKTQGLKRVRQGNHDARYDTEAASEACPITVFHFPVRSRRQFQRKIQEGGEAYARNMEAPATAGWHWRRLYRRLREQGLEAALADAVPSSAQIEHGLITGEILEDRRMVRRLAAYVSSPSGPSAP